MKKKEEKKEGNLMKKKEEKKEGNLMKKKEEKKEGKNQSIGALWVNKGKKLTYLAGEIELEGKLTKIVVFKNDYKQEDKQPDYRIYLRRENEEEQTTVDDLPF